MQEGWYDDRPRSFLIYAPSRTVVVYSLVHEDEAPVKQIESVKVKESAEPIESIEVEDEEPAEPVESVKLEEWLYLSV